MVPAAISDVRPSSKESQSRLEAVAHLALIAVVGLGYRAAFIAQGFNATDEGWLQSVARRITLGQVPYRDFRFGFPPVSILKEAALQRVLGDAYTILASRWVFSAEATVGSMLTYLILRRFTTPWLALAGTLPTIFFSVLYYYFANYTYDGEVLCLAAVAVLVYVPQDRPRWAMAAGALACLSALAKPNFVAFAVLVLVVGVAKALVQSRESSPPLFGVYAGWPAFLLGFVATFLVVLAGFGALGAAADYIRQAFLEAPGAVPQPPGYEIWQDLPTVFLPRELKLFALIALAMLVALIPLGRWFRSAVVLAIPLGIIAFSLRYIRADQGFIPMAMGVLLVVNGTALAGALAARAGGLAASAFATEIRRLLPKPELIAVALVLQYLAQFTYSGVVYSYIGAYLSLPVAILILKSLAELGIRNRSVTRLVAITAPALFGAWIVVASIAYVRNHVYFDAPRNELTAAFQSPKLVGITSNPANVARLDEMVSVVDQMTRPGDPILAVPDFPGIYYLTDRSNPTSQDWYLASDKRFLPPTEVERIVSELASDPPRVVFLQKVSEFDWSRTYRSDLLVDYSSPQLKPIYDYLLQHYHAAGMIGDITVLLPGPGT